MRHLQHALCAAAVLLAAAGCNGTGGPGAPPPVGRERLTRTEPPEALAGPVAPPAAVVYTQRSYREMAGPGNKVIRRRQRERIRATPQRLRLEDPTGVVVIVRADDQKTLQLFPGQRVYQTVTFDDRRKELDKILSELAYALPTLKGKARRAAENLIGRRTPEVSVAWAEKPVTIAGRECWHVQLREDGEVRLEFWVTPEFGVLPVMEAVTRLRGELSRALLAERAKIRGFPMRLRLYGKLPDQPLVLDARVEKIEVREALEGSLFEVPKGYTRAGRQRPAPSP